MLVNTAIAIAADPGQGGGFPEAVEAGAQRTR